MCRHNATRAQAQVQCCVAGCRYLDPADRLRGDTKALFRGRGHLDRAAHDAEHQRPGRVAFRPVEEFAHQARLQPLEDSPTGPPFHPGVDILPDPLDEILRPQADDVRLLRALDHPIRTPELRPANRSPTSRATTPLSWTWKRALVSPLRRSAGSRYLHPATQH